MSDHEYRDWVAPYLHGNFGNLGLLVRTEVPPGKTIIGKIRQLEIFALRFSDQTAIDEYGRV